MASYKGFVRALITRIHLSLTRSRIVPTSEEWESSRSSVLNLPPKDEDSGKFSNRADEYTGSHWLTAACFLEGIDPTRLRLEPILEERVIRETKRLEELEPLEASTVCLAIARMSDDEREDLGV